MAIPSSPRCPRKSEILVILVSSFSPSPRSNLWLVLLALLPLSQVHPFLFISTDAALAQTTSVAFLDYCRHLHCPLHSTFGAVLFGSRLPAANMVRFLTCESDHITALLQVLHSLQLLLEWNANSLPFMKWPPEYCHTLPSSVLYVMAPGTPPPLALIKDFRFHSRGDFCWEASPNLLCLD